MNEINSFLELAENIFYDFSKIKPGSTRIIFSKKIMFPIIKTTSELEIIIPLPRKQGDKYVFEGMLFDNDDIGRRDLWCLFLSTLYHLAAHACITRYSVYDSWKKQKTEDVCLNIIDYLEDISVEKYISHTSSEVWENIQNINSKLSSCLEQSHVVSNLKIYDTDITQKTVKIRTDVTNKPDNVLMYADLLYRNRELLPKANLPYCERHITESLIKTEQKSPNFEPFGIFQENIVKLDESWLLDVQIKSKILRRYEKYLKDLSFDSVVIPQGDFHNFSQIKENTLPLLRKIRQQLRMVANLVDEPKIDQIGYLNMQMAIQAIASEGQSTDIFERDEIKRVEEAWAILIDKSASMSLRFDQIKEFVVCVAESANELAGKSDAWAMFSFDNNFQILKDFKERYNHEVQARIGSLENNGLSLLPDAIELTRRILSEDPREKKYIFVITDGHPSGYERINQNLAKIAKKLDVSGVSLIAIGVSKSTSKRFKNSVRGSSDLRQLVSKFITTYKTISSDDM